MLFFANAIAGVGVLLLLLGHYFVSREKCRPGYWLAAGGGLLVMIGSMILESWSVVALNLVWIGLSLEGLRLLGRERQISAKSQSRDEAFKKLLPITFLVGMVLMVTGYYDLSAWACTAIYLVGYWLLTTKRMSNAEYMLWTFLGFFLLIDHLVERQSYSVLFNETLGALVSLSALTGYLQKSDKAATPSVAE
jgi:hypothetical protein